MTILQNQRLRTTKQPGLKGSHDQTHSLGVTSTMLEPTETHLHNLYILKSKLTWLWQVSVQFQQLSRLPWWSETALSSGSWLVSKETPKWSEEISECSPVTNKSLYFSARTLHYSFHGLHMPQNCAKKLLQSYKSYSMCWSCTIILDIKIIWWSSSENKK